MTVDIVVLEGGSPSGCGAVIDVLDAANRLAGEPCFVYRVLSPASPHVRLRGGMGVASKPLDRATPSDAVIVVGLGASGPGEILERIERDDARRVARWLGEANKRGRLLLATCTAVFLLADSGALAGRRATTTWWLAGALSNRHPDIEVRADELTLCDGTTWTAGASFAQLDLLHALVEASSGRALAEEVERRLAFRRRVSQVDFMKSGDLAAGDPTISSIESYVVANVGRPITLREMAESLSMSERTLSRRVQYATGLSPMKLVQRIRLDVAMHALRTSSHSTSTIARSIGFEDPTSLYRLIKRSTGRSPSQIRAAQ